MEPAASPPMYVVWAGEVPYDVALGWQERLVAARQEDAIDDVLLLLTHPPTYTAGRHADVEANLTGRRPDIPVVRIDRGGDLTYHGPGQVVAYPILRLAQRGAAKAYVTALEQALIDVLGSYGVGADRRAGYPGVWVARADGPPDKIAAIGVRITRGVSKHGIALNVDPVMADFDGIVPCGITDGGVTSLAAQGVDVDVEDVRTRLGSALARSLGRTPQPARPSDLGLWG
ncbi:lipoyl(octanoyl) transferase LipB [Euzebya sp.]|uniref:lipoyl(octanoyl) transferase LipB n=1 Tax=Euzebya sp. TaxID=1971409 RepID=UPI00351535C9